ncbi:MAG: hypothetical protein RBT37_02260 [Dissulfurispiraceae bacterium]|nr:hypothetical protein [Dissulfurispiraceae bacterium]
MPKIPVDKLMPGVVLAKPVLNEAGMVLLAQGTEIKAAHIDRLLNMNVQAVYIEGESAPDRPKDEVLAELEARFSKTINEPHMLMLKKIFESRIEELYK